MVGIVLTFPTCCRAQLLVEVEVALVNVLEARSPILVVGAHLHLQPLVLHGRRESLDQCHRGHHGEQHNSVKKTIKELAGIVGKYKLLGYPKLLKILSSWWKEEAVGREPASPQPRPSKFRYKVR